MDSYSKSNGVIEKNLLIFSILVGLLFRIYYLVNHDFWFDESFSYFVAALPMHQAVTVVLHDTNPPFYYLLLHVVTMFTSNPWVLRLPSLILNMLSGLLLFQIPSSIHKKAAPYALILFCLSPLTIFLAASARPHGAGLFFVLLIIWLFQRLIAYPSLQRKIVFILVSLLGLYTHYYVLLLFVALSFWLIKKSSHLSLTHWVYILLPIGVGFLPWALAYLGQPHAVCSCPPTYLSLPATLASPIAGGTGEVTLRRYADLPIVISLFFAVVVLGNIYLFWRGISRQQGILAYMYSIPLVVVSIIGMIGPFFSHRGFSIYGSLFLAIVAIGIATGKHSKRILIIQCLSFLFINTVQAVNPFFSGTPIRPIVNSINSNPAIPISHLSSFTYYPVKFYLPNATQTLLTTNPFSKNVTDSIGGTPISELPQPSFWLVDTEEWVDTEIRTTQLARISKEYTMAQEFTFSNVSIKLWELK